MTDQEEIKNATAYFLRFYDSHTGREEEKEPVFQMQELCIHYSVPDGGM